MAKYPCFYKNKLFIKFFEESELKIDKQVYSKDELIKNLSVDNGNNLILDSNGDHLNSSSSLDNQFPIPFQYLNSSNNQSLENKFKSKYDKHSNKDNSNNSTESNDTYLIDAAHLICQAQLNEERQVCADPDN